MMSCKRIVNASPLVFLARVGLLEVLRVDGFEVIIPQAVIEEVGRHGPDDPTIDAIQNSPWLKVVSASAIPKEVLEWDLGPGESAVLALALTEPGSRTVLDDLEARRCARSLSIPVVGTLGMVTVAKEEGRIPAARPVVERLRSSGMYLSDRVVNYALDRVCE